MLSVISVHQIVSVYHPLNAYHVLDGSLGNVHNIVLYTTLFVSGVC